MNFYWEEAGRKIGIVQPVSSFGLNYVIRKPKAQTVVALITLPIPQTLSEAYFVALRYRPYRVTPILRVADTTKVLSLELAIREQATNEEQKFYTLLVEWSRKLKREVIDRGPTPFLDSFYPVVIDMLID